MWGKTLALIATVITGASFVTDSVSAQVRVITNDATAQFVPLEVGKFMAIDLPVDAKDVMVGKRAIADVIMGTARRYFILAIAPGQTNIAFYDVAMRQIEAFDVTVQTYPISAASALRGPEDVVIVFRGNEGRSLSCTHTSELNEGAACYAREEVK
jgi:Flp pilus assembly secretin CpaC